MTNALTIKQPNEDALQSQKTWTQQLQTYAKGLSVTDAKSEAAAADAMRQIRVAQDRLTAERQSFTQPLYGVIKKFEALFRPLLKDLDTVFDQIEAKLLAYRRAEADARAAALAEAARLATQTQALAPAQVPVYQALVAQGSTPLDSKVSGVSMKKVWRARVDNPTQVPMGILLDGQPVALWKIDENVLAMIASQKENTVSIPGVTFYSEEVVGRVQR